MNNVSSLIDPAMTDMIIRLAVAALLGAIIGAQRSASNKTAGMRTYSLISMGACLFVAVSHIVSDQYLGLTAFDPLHVAAQIVVGIGFVGGGIIMTQGHKVSGITTAAGLWVSAGIGMAVGFQLYSIAVFCTFATLFIFTALWHLEKNLIKYSGRGAKRGDDIED